MPNFSQIRVRASAAIVHEDKILLVAYNDDLVGIHFNLPGGGVEPGEQLHETVHREVREETGAEIVIRRLLLTWEYNTAHSTPVRPVRVEPHSLGFVFLAELAPGSPPPAMPYEPDNFQTGVVWIPLESLPDEPLLPHIGPRIVKALGGELDDLFCVNV